ncbi:MobA/MobL family protein [Rhabdaerophilum calidifontis]|uniref:MobA/MobL family protein n=1 Tax=Rhabdaerophilum calidifontis TaxID=2604328 RepID=UPI00123A32F0|nr:MobA/MobL family protein [Rhabdaerophilum calidifontis]
MDSYDNALKLFNQRQERAAARLARAKQAELDREIEEAMRVTHAAIAAAERRALKILNARVGSERAQVLFRAWWTSPGLMTVAGMMASPIIATSRPTSSEGRVSFHFDVRHVTTGGLIVDLLVGRVPWRAIGKFKDLGSVAHQKYIEREDGVETLDPGDAANHQGYIERDGATETDERERSSWGTISSDPQERLEFWRQLEEVENKPRPTVLAFDPDADPEIWSKAIRSRDFPERVFAEIVAGSRSVAVSDNEALMVFRAFARAGFVASAKRDPAKPAPVRFALGRGGNVQTRMIVSLPHEMTARERLALAKEYTAEFESLGIPYWAVIHAPGPSNDPRNYHLHINLATRPAKKIPHPVSGELVWDFSIEAVKTYANDTKRVIRPFTQEKIREMNARKWIPTERSRFARIANKHLERGEYDKRLDPRTHKAMGLPPPWPHLSKADYGRERRGLTTPRGVKLANQQWEDDVHSIARTIQCNARSTRSAKAKAAKESDVVPTADGADIAYLHALSHVALRITSRFRLRSSDDESLEERAAEQLSEALDREIGAEFERLTRRNFEQQAGKIKIPAREKKPRDKQRGPSVVDGQAHGATSQKTGGNPPRTRIPPTQSLPSSDEAIAVLAALKASNPTAPQETEQRPDSRPAKPQKAGERKRVMIARQRGKGGMER